MFDNSFHPAFNFRFNNITPDRKTMASSTTPKPPAIIRHLTTLPRELIHNIIDNLCISQVLSLSLSNDPFIDECIIGHLNYKCIFHNLGQLRKLTEYFRIYSEILIVRSISLHKYTTQLAAHPAWSKITYDELVAHLHVQVVGLIDRGTPGTADLAALSALSPTPLHSVWNSSDLPRLRSRWALLNKLIRALNAKKSEQLQKLRDLVLEYPGLLRADLEIPNHRSSLNHMVGELEWRIKALRSKRGICAKRLYPFRKGLPVLPYDRHLRLFLKVLERYPLPDGYMPSVTRPKGKIPVQGEALSAQQHEKILCTPAETTARLNHQYTPEATENIRRAILGLTYVYTSTSTSFVPPGSTLPISSPVNAPPPAPTLGFGYSATFGQTSSGISKKQEIAPAAEITIIRTKQTPYSAYPHNKTYGHFQPCFVIPDGMEAYAALAEMEIQWLESFLWSCRYMANMHDARWNEVMSVGEMWCKRS